MMRLLTPPILRSSATARAGSGRSRPPVHQHTGPAKPPSFRTRVEPGRATPWIGVARLGVLLRRAARCGAGRVRQPPGFTGRHGPADVRGQLQPEVEPQPSQT